MSGDVYRKMLKDNITKSYKTTHSAAKDAIDREASSIAARLGISRRVETYAQKDAYITLKDHKEDFWSRPSCRLINPAKSEIGMISKQILEQINSSVRTATALTQWRNTQSVIDWFTKLPSREGVSFIKFDIVEFYPSISEGLLSKALGFAKAHTAISTQDEEIIWHARKSLLFGDNSTWVKREGGQFDVTMGSYDGAEVCELVGLYLLDQLSQLFDKERIGLYRDDGLSALKLTGPQADHARKKIIQVFKKCNLRVTVDIQLRRTDFLDVTLDLESGKYWPFRKPNCELQYVHAQSSHPPTVLKHLPNAITSRISALSCNQDEFAKAIPDYKDALERSGHHPTTQPAQPARGTKRQRHRNVIWFNPPYSQNVTTDVASRFLKLINRHFPRHHKYHKLFNRKNVKVSYSCMPNMGSIIAAHNNRILSPSSPTPVRSCNCRQPQCCPLDGKCLSTSIVYKASVTAPDRPTKVYYGLTEGTFKARYANHVSSIKNQSHRKDTELSKYMWDLQDQGLLGTIKWEIAKRASPYKCGSRRCDLCLTEKLAIALADPTSLLNKRSEIISTCRHRRKFSCTKV